MAKYEDRDRDSKPRGGGRSRGGFGGGSRSGGGRDRDSRGGASRGPRNYDRESSGRSRFSRDRPEITMTKVTCDACGSKCEVPFKPSSDKPIYCSDCFSKNKSNSNSRDKSNNRGVSDRDLDLINEKLDKIMANLNINVE